MDKELIANCCRVIVEQTLRYYLPDGTAPRLKMEVTPTTAKEISLSYAAPEHDLQGVLEGSCVDVVDNLHTLVTRLIEAITGTPSPFSVSLNFSTSICDVCQRPVGSDLLVYEVLPIVCEQYVKLAQTLRTDDSPVDVGDLWLYARHFYNCSAIPELAQKILARDKKKPNVKAYLSAHDPKKLSEALIEGFWKHQKEHGDPAERKSIAKVQKRGAFLVDPSIELAEFNKGLKTRSVIVALKAWAQFFNDHQHNPVALVALAGEFEWLIYHDINELKNKKKAIPIMTDLLFKALAHDSRAVRKRYRAVGGIWLNYHLVTVEGEEALAARVFEAIADDCAMVRLFAVGGEYTDRPGMADIYRQLGDEETVKRLEAFEPFAVKHEDWIPHQRWRAPTHYGPPLPTNHGV